jgi:hypothetical protein
MYLYLHSFRKRLKLKILLLISILVSLQTRIIFVTCICPPIQTMHDECRFKFKNITTPQLEFLIAYLPVELLFLLMADLEISKSEQTQQSEKLRRQE